MTHFAYTIKVTLDRFISDPVDDHLCPPHFGGYKRFMNLQQYKHSNLCTNIKIILNESWNWPI